MLEIITGGLLVHRRHDTNLSVCNIHSNAVRRVAPCLRLDRMRGRMKKFRQL